MSTYRLLVIEDDKNFADIVCRVARDCDFDVLALDQARAVHTLYDEFAPHIIVLDIVMPEMDGMEILNFLHIRNSPSHIVILSGEGQYRPMASMLGTGFGLSIYATIAKPFRLIELRKTFEDIKLLLSTADQPIARTNV